MEYCKWRTATYAADIYSSTIALLLFSTYSYLQRSLECGPLASTYRISRSTIVVQWTRIVKKSSGLVRQKRTLQKPCWVSLSKLFSSNWSAIPSHMCVSNIMLTNEVGSSWNSFAAFTLATFHSSGIVLVCKEKLKIMVWPIHFSIPKILEGRLYPTQTTYFL